MVGGVDVCLVAFKKAVERGLSVKDLYCNKCQFPHIDLGDVELDQRTYLC